MANIADAITLLKQPAGTYKDAAVAAQAKLDAFEQRDAARKAADTAQAALNAQEDLTAAAVRAGAKQIKGLMDVPQEVLDLLELNAAATDTAGRVGAEAPVLKVKMDGIHPSIS